MNVFRDNSSQVLHPKIMFHWGRFRKVEPRFWVQNVPIVRWPHLDCLLTEVRFAPDLLRLHTSGIDHRMVVMSALVLRSSLVSVRFDGTEGVSKAINEAKIIHTSTS
jgi:hypothetical protein